MQSNSWLKFALLPLFSLFFSCSHSEEFAGNHTVNYIHFTIKDSSIILNSENKVPKIKVVTSAGDHLDLNEVAGKAYTFNFEKMRVEIEASDSLFEQLKYFDSHVLKEDNDSIKVDRYIYGMGKIDGLYLCGFHGHELLFTINTTWQEGIISDEILKVLKGDTSFKNGLLLFQINLPHPPLPPE